VLFGGFMPQLGMNPALANSQFHPFDMLLMLVNPAQYYNFYYQKECFYLLLNKGL
jgi:hypothetical protein